MIIPPSTNQASMARSVNLHYPSTLCDGPIRGENLSLPVPRCCWETLLVLAPLPCT
jgi:hypothetical protein